MNVRVFSEHKLMVSLDGGSCFSLSLSQMSETMKSCIKFWVSNKLLLEIWNELQKK